MHIPFCVVKCGYCDFNSFAGVENDSVDAILAAILEELRQSGLRPRPRTIYLGGGTPTQLSPTQLSFLLDGLHELVDFSEVSEFSCEANPESVSREKLELLLHAGVNRLSLGVQSFDPQRLSFLDRPHSPDEAVRAFELGRAMGFRELSLDLIFAIPGQSLDDWVAELDQGLALAPEHISAYNLTFEAGTPLHLAKERALVTEIPEEQSLELLQETRARMKQAGYEAYEISNFARRGHACRHNLNYWRGGDYLGLGPGACSHRSGWRSNNYRPLEAYLEALRQGRPAAQSAESLAPGQRCREAIWLGLRLAEGADLERIEEQTGLAALVYLEQEIEQQVAAGRCFLEDKRLILAPGALRIADRVAASFL